MQIIEKINIKKFIPEKILPKSGDYKELITLELENQIILSTMGCKKKIALPNSICLEPSDFIAIGLYLAEGSTYSNFGRKYNHDGEITFISSHPEAMLIFCNLLSEFNIKVDILKWKIGLNINHKKNTDTQELLNYWNSKIGLSFQNLRPKHVYFTGKIGRRITSSLTI